MCKIALRTASGHTVTKVPNRFIDEFMADANGSYIKIYLYLLRCLTSDDPDIAISAIADKLEYTEKDIVRALRYWAKKGLLDFWQDETGTVTSILLTDLLSGEEPVPAPEKRRRMSLGVQPSEPSAPLQTTQKTSNVEPFPARPNYSAEELAEFSQDETVSWILSIIEQYMEHPLGPNDLQTALYIYKDLQFSSDLIFYLYEYCISRNQKGSAYILKVALNWHKDGIDTVEKAEDATTSYHKNYQTVRQAFGLNRQPGAIERRYITKWFETYHHNAELVAEACARTLLAVNKPDFKYADRILEKWHQYNAASLEDVKKLDEAFSKSKETNRTRAAASQSAAKPKTNQFHNFDQREYSEEEMAEIELRLRKIPK